MSVLPLRGREEEPLTLVTCYNLPSVASLLILKDCGRQYRLIAPSTSLLTVAPDIYRGRKTEIVPACGGPHGPWHRRLRSPKAHSRSIGARTRRMGNWTREFVRPTAVPI
jgi:hypothetical protein